MANYAENVSQLVRAVLMEDSTVTDLVAARIYSVHSMSTDDPTQPLPGIFIDVLGGDSRYNAQVQNIAFDLFACSRISQSEAFTVYKAAYDALQATRLVLSNVSSKGYCREMYRPDAMYIDQMKAWCARGNWQALTAG